MNAALSLSTSAANEAANLALSRNRYPSWGGSIGGTGAPGGGSLISVRHGLALVWRKGGDIDESRDLGIVAGLR